jgi:hypothetical protein
VEHKRVRQIVDILGCAGEVKVLLEVFQLCVLVKFFLQEILDGFDIVIRHFFDLFYSGSVFDRKVIENLSHPGVLFRDSIYSLLVGFDNILLKKSGKPSQLHLDPVAHQSILREVSAETVTGTGVPTVDR